jgi:hypothetical protein
MITTKIQTRAEQLQPKMNQENIATALEQEALLANRKHFF